MVFNTAIADPLERIKDSIVALRSESANKYYDALALSSLQPYTAQCRSATQCTVTYRLTVTGALCNRMGNLHGGAAATLFDIATSLALAPLARGSFDDDDPHADAPFWLLAGVSRSLSCTYLRPVPDGSEVAVVCEVLGLSKRLAFIRGEMWAWDVQRGCVVGAPLVVCEHGKVNVMPALGTDAAKL